jgi:hypothetical protein
MIKNTSSGNTFGECETHICVSSFFLDLLCVLSPKNMKLKIAFVSNTTYNVTTNPNSIIRTKYIYLHKISAFFPVFSTLNTSYDD